MNPLLVEYFQTEYSLFLFSCALHLESMLKI